VRQPGRLGGRFCLGALKARGGFLVALLCIVTRRARNCGKALRAHNRTVEFDELLARKWRKLG
jgi:hypothetical protein